MSTRHVILTTYGEPPQPDFGSQLLYSWRILLGLTRTVAPIPKVLLPVIAVSRAGSRARGWKREHYQSPLEHITLEQARGLARILYRRQPATRWSVQVAYEFRDPLVQDALDSVPVNEPVDVIPMYVADSAFTHELAREVVVRWARDCGRSRGAPTRVLGPVDEERYAEMCAGHLWSELAAAGEAPNESWGVVLAAHGTLLDPPRPMETGRAATLRIGERIAALLAARFGRIEVGWLNHARGGRWTEPPVERVLERFAADGYRRLVYFPYGFYADNAESQMEGRLALREHAWDQVLHLPCVNQGEALLEGLADLVLGGPDGPRHRVSSPWKMAVSAPTG